MPLAKSWGSKEQKTGGKYFKVANCLKTHGTECDNFAQQLHFFLLALLADYL